jgi:ABC-type polysaccharide/polyol phosphate export permease
VERDSSGATLLAGVREVMAARELLGALARRDLLVRYEFAALGIGWALAVPVLQLGIFTLVFTRVAPLETLVPYPLYAYAGLTLWSFFAASVRTATRSLTDHAALVTKTYFPREALPFASVLVAFVDFAIASLPLAALMLYYGIRPGWTIMALPVVVVTAILLTAGIALLASMANLFYRDVRHLVDVLLLVGMFASPVAYPLDRIGGAAGAILALNPVRWVLDAYRAALFGGPADALLPLAASLGAAVVLLGGAWTLFRRVEHRFAELA